ncbi:hypothetical protein D3C87_1431500 [compost metagenome]
MRDLQKQNEDADQRHIEDDQHGVADKHAGDNAPEELGMFGEDLRSWYHILHQECAHDDADHCIGRNPEAKHRNETRLCGRIIGALRSCYTFDRALAEPLRCPGQLLFQQVTSEAGDQCPTARQKAEKEAENRSACDWSARNLPVFPGRKQVAQAVRWGRFGFSGVPSFDHHQHFAHPKQAHGKNGDVEAVTKIADFKGESLFTRDKVDADG